MDNKEKKAEAIGAEGIRSTESPPVVSKGIHAILSVEETKEIFAETRRFIKGCFVEGVDFEVSERGKEKVVNLLKPGAEKLMAKFILRPEFHLQDKFMDWETRIFYFEIKCSLFHIPTGLKVAEYIASANSREEKHRYRWLWENELPPGTDMKNLISKPAGQGKKYRMENLLVEDQISTLIQIAEKRGLVGGVRLATQTSDEFTQPDVGESNGFRRDIGKEKKQTTTKHRTPEPGKSLKISLTTKKAILLALQHAALNTEEKERIGAKLDGKNVNEVTEKDLFTEPEARRVLKYIAFREKVAKTEEALYSLFTGDIEAAHDFAKQALSLTKVEIAKLTEIQLDKLKEAIEAEMKRQEKERRESTGAKNEDLPF